MDDITIVGLRRIFPAGGLCQVPKKQTAWQGVGQEFLTMCAGIALQLFYVALDLPTPHFLGGTTSFPIWLLVAFAVCPAVFVYVYYLVMLYIVAVNSYRWTSLFRIPAPWAFALDVTWALFLVTTIMTSFAMLFFVRDSEPGQRWTQAVLVGAIWGLAFGGLDLAIKGVFHPRFRQDKITRHWARPESSTAITAGPLQ